MVVLVMSRWHLGDHKKDCYNLATSIRFLPKTLSSSLSGRSPTEEDATNTTLRFKTGLVCDGLASVVNEAIDLQRLQMPNLCNTCLLAVTRGDLRK